AKRAKRALAAHPKFYLFDTGVYRAIRPKGPLDRPQEIDGLALEGLVGQHLRAWIDYGDKDSRLCYWRTRSGVEVDFVVYGPDGIRAVEVKNARRLEPHDLTGLKSFREDYPQASLCLLYRGRDRLVRDGVPVVPCEEFLRALKPGKWPANFS
ncbi:MAG: DUF4143 domain-containing protein, partial [bacterium]